MLSEGRCKRDGRHVLPCSYDDWKKQQDEAAAREAAMEAAARQEDGKGLPERCSRAVPVSRALLAAGWAEHCLARLHAEEYKAAMAAERARRLGIQDGGVKKKEAKKEKKEKSKKRKHKSKDKKKVGNDFWHGTDCIGRVAPRVGFLCF